MHTPGPWYWEKTKHNIRLMTPKNRLCIVMDFVRRGMQGAQPRFSDRGDRPLGGIMHNADEIDLAQNPDARLIAAAPKLLEACQAAYADLEQYEDTDIPGGGGYAVMDTVRKLRAAIAAATGKNGIE